MIPATLDPKRLDGLILTRGSHPTRTEGMNVTEAAAFVAGEEHTSMPECASPVLCRFVLHRFDAFLTDEARNAWGRPLVIPIIGSRRNNATETARAYVLVDWALRQRIPVLARSVGLTTLADALAALPQIADAATAHAAYRITQWARGDARMRKGAVVGAPGALEDAYFAACGATVRVADAAAYISLDSVASSRGAFAAYYAAEAVYAAIATHQDIQHLAEVARVGGESAAHRVADALIGNPLRAKWAPLIEETNQQAQALTIRLARLP